MFLFGGVFFPFSGLPEWAQVVGWCLPLSHLVAATRDLTLGGADLMTLAHVGVPGRHAGRGLPVPRRAPAADAAPVSDDDNGRPPPRRRRHVAVARRGHRTARRSSRRVTRAPSRP